METVTAEIDINGDVVTATEYLTYSTAHEVIYALFCMAGMCADFIIVHILFRFRRMRTIPNIFLSNWIIADACYLLFLALYYIISIIMTIISSINLSPNYYCVLVQMEVALYFATVYFVTLISIDWLIAAYFDRYIERFRNYYKLAIGFVWIFSFMFWGVFTGVCFKTGSYDVALGYNIFVVCVVSLFIIALQVHTALLKFKNRPMEYSHLMLTLTSVFMLSRAPDFIQYMVYLMFGAESVPLKLMIMYITPLHSMLNLFLLYWLNKDFQACLRQFLQRSDQRYMEATTDFENEDQQQFPVHISINNSNEELSPNGL